MMSDAANDTGGLGILEEGLPSGLDARDDIIVRSRCAKARDGDAVDPSQVGHEGLELSDRGRDVWGIDDAGVLEVTEEVDLARGRGRRLAEPHCGAESEPPWV